jgi:hypothetical protein
MSDNREVHNHYSGGIGIGTICAAILSWLKWHSIGWVIVHALLGWLYVIYYLIKFGFPYQLFQ